MQWNFEYLRLRFPDKKRLRFFSIFVAVSFLFWIITKLSNSYSSFVEFDVNFVNAPPLIVLDENPNARLRTDITASGFELLIYHFIKNEINVSIENADYNLGTGKIDLMGQKFGLQQQLYKNVRLNRVSPSHLNFKYGKLKRLKVPIIPPNNINFKPGYDQAGNWLIQPDSVWIYGPSKEVNKISGLSIESLKENDIDGDIEETLKLLPINQIQYETHEVLVKTKVKRFTEKSVEAFINIKNLPDSLAIKLFPQSINITFLVLIEKADVISARDFKFSCDYDQAQINDTNSLDIFLDIKPNYVRNVKWKIKKVDYLIRK